MNPVWRGIRQSCFVFFLSIFFALIAGCCSRLALPRNLNIRTWPSAVLRVADGDTIVIVESGRARRVRLLGVDAPRVGREPGANTRGDRAKAWLEARLAGRAVYLEFDPVAREDAYGRLLAYVWLTNDPATQDDDELLNAALVREGWCRAVGDWCRSLRHGREIFEAGKAKTRHGEHEEK